MNAFVQTQVTLLRRMADESAAEYESAWTRFYDLYYPTMLNFVASLGGVESAEDVVQGVLVKLVGILRDGGYRRREGGTFRAYLKTLLRHELTDWYRRETARGRGRKTVIREDDAAEDPVVFARIELEWRLARRKAIVEHVLSKTAMSEKSKAVYRAYVLEARDIGEVAAAFGLTRNDVSQIKVRVDRRIAAVEELAEEDDENGF